MERAIFTLFVLMIVALIAVQAKQCSDSNAMSKYVACERELDMFLQKKDAAASRCKELFKKAVECYKKLRGNCGKGPVAKWMEYASSASQIKMAKTYSCGHLKEMRSLLKCASKDFTGYAKCIKKAIKSKTDLCGQWNAMLPCNRKFLVSCSDKTVKVAEKMLEFQRPRGCKIKKDPSVTMTTKGM